MIDLNLPFTDLVALATFVLCWFGYGPSASLIARRRPSLISAVRMFRRAWIGRMCARENHVADAALLGNLLRGALFFASTTVFILGGLAALLGTASRLAEVTAHLPYASAADARLAEIKVLPFIPNDLKRAFGLPLYVEKDAIYAYHFYRLLQRAKDTVITYDSETDTFGKGEKSRFVTQLQLEMNKFNPNIQIIEKVASYPGFPLELKNIIAIQKDENIMERILKKASSIEPFGGLSPSGLIAHKECPLRFYFRYGAGLKEIKEVEESAEANTFGSILHLSLENLYSDFTGKIIHPESLKEQLKKVDLQVNQSFISFFDNNPPSGKSLLQEEVIKVYVKKLIKSDLKFIEGLKKQNQVLTLSGLEQEFSAPLNLIIEGQPTLIYIKGKVDRIDSFGGKVRVMDYKSSVKTTDKFSFDGFEKLFLDKNYNKQLQLILYCWMIFKNGLYQATQLTPCIVPFKNFSDEPKFILSGKEILTLTDHFLNDFETELTNYVEEIFNRQIPFTQTDDKDAHKYCPYNTICNFAN